MLDKYHTYIFKHIPNSFELANTFCKIFISTFLVFLLIACRETSSKVESSFQKDTFNLAHSSHDTSIKTCNDLLVELVKKSGHKNPW